MKPNFLLFIEAKSAKNYNTFANLYDAPVRQPNDLIIKCDAFWLIILGSNVIFDQSNIATIGIICADQMMMMMTPCFYFASSSSVERSKMISEMSIACYTIDCVQHLLHTSFIFMLLGNRFFFIGHSRNHRLLTRRKIEASQWQAQTSHEWSGIS